MQPRVGDTVVLNVEVVEVIGDKLFRYMSHTGSPSLLVSQSIIKEVITRHLQVGDKVLFLGYPCELVAIYKDWGIISFSGSKPSTVPIKEIKLSAGS